jgi:hypothetical protein
MKVIRQIIRGCGELPHVGDHPGSIWLFMFILMGLLAGVQSGLWGAFGGATLMALFMLPLYLWGAYDRAQLSDRLVERELNPNRGCEPKTN